jgi:hypothetical protein
MIREYSVAPGGAFPLSADMVLAKRLQLFSMLLGTHPIITKLQPRFISIRLFHQKNITG